MGASSISSGFAAPADTPRTSKPAEELIRELFATLSAVIRLPRLPVDGAELLRRARSLAAHSPAQDARQVQFHYDVSDDFYALWLDPRRVYSCAYFRDAGMSLAQAS